MNLAELILFRTNWYLNLVGERSRLIRDNEVDVHVNEPLQLGERPDLLLCPRAPRSRSKRGLTLGGVSLWEEPLCLDAPGPLVAFRFTIRGGKVVGIELVADPERTESNEDRDFAIANDLGLS